MQVQIKRVRSLWQRAIACAVLISYVGVLPVNAIAQVVPKGGSGLTVYNNPNGVPVVNINTANAAGLSHNQYTQYNVDGRGLVLNNNPGTSLTAPTNSQLAGSLLTNTNLASPARVILNEVVGGARSVLAGYTEVAGARADVVVANPYGITCNGCGFINTSRAALTTGVPVLGADGSLKGYQVSGGDILVTGQGLDGTNPALLDLVSRSIMFNGQVNGHDVVVATGNGTFDVSSRVLTPMTTIVDPEIWTRV